MKTLVYDNTIEGFLTSIFYCYKKNEFDINIKNSSCQQSLLDQTVKVETNAAQAKRVKNGIIKKVGINLYNEINTVFCSDNKNKDQVLFEYLKLVFAFGKKARLMLNNEHVIAYNNLLKQVTYERHRMIGFMRFEETVDGVMYAKYSPDNNITHLLLKHFTQRFSTQSFIIHDTKRNLVGIYNNQNNTYFTHTLQNKLTPPKQTNAENFFQKLWQSYYNNVSIAERKNTKTMLNFMPKRYHHNLTELKG